MAYQKLSLDQYFIDTSDDYNDTGKARFNITYKEIEYEWKGDKCWKANYETHYEADRNVIQIHFEKTSGDHDWISNFIFFSKFFKAFKWTDPESGKSKFITLRVASGWRRMYLAMKDAIRSEVSGYLKDHPDAEIEICGWSQGSGLAMICAQDMYYNFNIRSHVFTYGSTNPFKTFWFNHFKTMKYLKYCCKECYNIYDVNDIVGYVPFWFWGFHKINSVKVAQDKFSIKRLFNPGKYHCEYDKPELYTNVK